MITAESSNIISFAAPARARGGILMSKPVTGLKERDEWMRAFLARHQQFKRGDLAVAMRIALHLNCKTGQNNPGHDTLAEELGISTKTVQRAIEELEATGWIERRAPGGHNNIEFVLKMPSPEWTPDVHPKGGSVTRDVTQSGWTKNGARVDIKRAQGGHLMSEQEQTTDNRRGRAPARPPDRALSVDTYTAGDDGEDEIPY